mmetsp:Transcript_23285/g.26526  ORF Transcript_23285/g.26526 Transcript_23285/m.26526 type:complete len:159 (+) Transcript_23285:59-535(+)
MTSIFKNNVRNIFLKSNERIEKACLVPIDEEHQLMAESVMDEDCERECVQLHDHIKKYLDENLNLWWKQNFIPRDLNASSLSSSSCNYEGWISKYLPENVKDDDSSVEFDESLKEHRFYLEDSDHRRIWNEYVEIYGCPQLKVEARAIERLQSKQYVN